MTRRRVADERYGALTRRAIELIRRVDEGSLRYKRTFDALQLLIEDQISDEDIRQVKSFIQGMFIGPEIQLDLVRKRNKERGWGFTDEDFKSLQEPPQWPEDKLSAVVLDVSLDTIQQTFEEAWHFVVAGQPDNKRSDEVKSDQDHLRLLKGIKHERGLHWRIINLAGNWDGEKGAHILKVRNSQQSPSSAILWAASYFPRWVQFMDGIKVPYVFIPGYESDFSDAYTHREEQPWTHAPTLAWKDTFQVVLHALAVDWGYSEYAVPVFLE